MGAFPKLAEVKLTRHAFTGKVAFTIALMTSQPRSRKLCMIHGSIISSRILQMMDSGH